MPDAPSIIVPVFDEEALLPYTVSPLLREAGAIGAELVFVCNGCRDRSADLLRAMAGEEATILELIRPGKAAALRAGEEEVAGFPRFFIDADVILRPGCLSRLQARLASGRTDLVAPRLTLETGGCTPDAARVAEVWGALPHMRREGVHNVLGLSRQARAAWGRFPDLRADNAFITAQVPPHRRAIVPQAEAALRPPRTLSSWVGVRRRWQQGHSELRALGIGVPRTPGQRTALLRMLLSGRSSRGAFLYLLVGLAGRLRPATAGRWFTDRSTRTRPSRAG